MRGGLRQSMAWLHTWAGLPVGWVLYFVFLTGTLGYFDSEIDQWMRPEAPLPSPALSQMDGLALALARLEQVAARAPRWTVFPPSGHDVPHVTISWSTADASGRPLRRSETLDATTGAPFRTRATGGGQTLYQLHYTLHYLPSAAARWLVGICSMLMLVALVSGVITHKKILADFFTFRPRQGQRSWLDIHNLVGVTALPFHLVITYSGLVFFVFTYMSPVVDATYGPEGRDRFFDEAFRNPEIPPPSGAPAPLAPLVSLYDEAVRHWGEEPVRVASFYNPGDRNARVVFTRTHVDPVSNGGRMVFAGATGELLHRFDRRTGPMVVNHALLGLHEGLFAGSVLRWLYFLTGLLGTAMIGTGLVLWTAKRKAKLASAGSTPPAAVRVIEHLNAGTLVGLPIGIAAYFWANRLLPVGMADRAAWEVHALFLAWLAMLVLPWLRPPDRAWHDSLRLAACAYAALPVLNALTTEQHLGVTIPAGAWALAGFDLVALATGLGFGVAAVVLRRQEVAVAAAERLPGSDEEMPAVSATTPLPEDAAG